MMWPTYKRNYLLTFFGTRRNAKHKKFVQFYATFERYIVVVAISAVSVVFNDFLWN